MLQWLLNVYLDGVVREENARMFGRELKINELVFEDDKTLVTDSVKLCRLTSEFGRRWERKLRVNVGIIVKL